MRRVAKVAAVFLAVGGAAWGLLPKPPLLDGVSFSTVVRDREGRILQLTPSLDGKMRVFTPLAMVSPRVVRATLFHEDRYFSGHPGVNPVALGRAAWQWISGPARGGASTVTMQVARLRYDLHTRSLAGKCGQIFDALCLERHYTKDEILEAYFNLAPYGANIEGIGAASWIYLHRPPDALSWPEAVTLSVIPQSPSRRTPSPERDNVALVAAHRGLYGRLLAARIVPDELGRDFRLRAGTRPPMSAPHFANAVRQILPAQREIRTTLDGRRQQILEEHVGKYVAEKSSLGIHNAAAMLVDTRRMEVLASVGSADFWNRAIDGQVDGTRSPRSPGSALKPFIYALALDQGLIHPQSLLLDAPRRFADYNPDNFDREFCGPISAADALARSRNVPAVELTSRLRSPSFYEFLSRVDVLLPRREEDYGLALALGGGEVTMQDMVRLYAMLANGGQLRPLKMVAAMESKGRRVLSAESAFLTLDMLARVSRPDGTPTDPRRVVSWKTGTSHGFRDAWAVAVFDHFVMAVWVGNFRGAGNPAFIGRTCAGPLLFQMIDRLEAGGEARLMALEPPAGANLRRVDFCAVSGDLPSPFCKHRQSGWFLPGVSPITACAVHREVLVDVRSGLRMLQDDGSCRREVFEFWPSNVLRLFEQAGLPRRVPPPYAPECAIDVVSRDSTAPRIVSPTAGESYAVRSGKAGGSSLPLTAQADGGVKKIHWFAGTEYLGCTAPGQALVWNARPGMWRILALDDRGRSATRTVTVLAAVR